MQLRNWCENEWIERPQGWMGRGELRDLVDRLRRVPYGTSSIHIEWDGVTHLDFRGLSGLAAEMRRIRDQGIAVRFSGFSPYLIAILRFALSIDEIEMFDSFRDGLCGRDRSEGAPPATRLAGVRPSIRLSPN